MLLFKTKHGNILILLKDRSFVHAHTCDKQRQFNPGETTGN